MEPAGPPVLAWDGNPQVRAMIRTGNRRAWRPSRGRKTGDVIRTVPVPWIS